MLTLLKPLDAVLAVATLLGCALFFHERFSTELLVVCLLTLLLAGLVFSRSRRIRALAGRPLAEVGSQIVVEWSGVVAVLLFLGFALKTSADFSRALMLSWFLITPAALFAAHLIRNHAGGLQGPGGDDPAGA
jgi:putative colanic acid biosysnthesis UDP-glucose lipid carrier transferase